MDIYRFGQFGIGMAFVGVAGEYYTFLNGNNSGVILSGFVALIGILMTLVAAIKEH